MEIDECSAGGEESVSEEEADDDSINGSKTDSSSESTSGSSSSSESLDDSNDEQDSCASDTHTSDNDDDDQSVHQVPDNSIDKVRWETCIAAGKKLKLPQDFCEHETVFHDLLDFPYIWNNCLSNDQKLSLEKYLPKLPNCDNKIENEKTINLLFQGENKRFGVSPLETFRNHLSAGHYRPDIQRMRRLVKKAQQRRLIFESRKRTYELADQLFKSRENLLINAYKQGYSQPTSHRTMSKLHWRKPRPAAIEEKTQQRYAEELNNLHNELGICRLADTTSENEENYPDYQMSIPKPKKKRKIQMGNQSGNNRLNNFDDDIRPVFSTLERFSNQKNYHSLREITDDSYRLMLIAHRRRRQRRDVHPELNVQGISLSELSQRAQIGQKQKITGPTIRMTPATKKRIKIEQNSQPSQVLPPPPLPSPPPPPPVIKTELEIEDNYQEIPQQIIPKLSPVVSDSPIKLEPQETFELPATPKKKTPSPKTPVKQSPKILKTPEIKKEEEEFMEIDNKPIYFQPIEEQHFVESEQEEDPELIEESNKELDLENIDMMQIPIQLEDGMDILDSVKCPDDEILLIPKQENVQEVNNYPDNLSLDLMQETHTCFFSLLRDAFMSRCEFRMSIAEMKTAVTLWQGNPISPLNDWYSFAPSWTNLVPLALGFLAGELTHPLKQDQDNQDNDFVPYLENKGKGIYAWIGAGRDSDAHLLGLCSRFLSNRDSLGPAMINQIISTVPITVPVSVSMPVTMNFPIKTIIPGHNSNGSAILSQNSGPAVESITNESGVSATVIECEPPQAVCPTEWKVRLSTAEEKEEFRRQERLRYAAPHKAFTYRMHGYSSVVGPVKGIYQHNPGAGLTKPRGHSLLVPERPNFVTILALVRDATARLPNGEGTRADICMLLKDSQYIKDQADQIGNDKDNYLNSVVSGALDRLHYEADPCVRYYPRRKEWLYLHRARSESEFEKFHQQLQGVAKNKKNSGGSSRNKSTQSSPKLVNGREPSPSGKDSTKKERKITGTMQQPLIKKEIQVCIKQEDKQQIEQSVQVSTEVPVSISSPAITTTTTTVGLTSVTTTTTTTTTTATTESTTPPVVIKEEFIPQQNQSQNILTPVKKIGMNFTNKPVTVVKTNSSQSLLQSNQHFPHHQIQVSTSAGLQTIRLSGHSVLHSAQPVATTSAGTSTSPGRVATILQNAKIPGTIVGNQAGKSILQTSNIKPVGTATVAVATTATTTPTGTVVSGQPGKTLLASQIKLVSPGQIKSLLTSHGLQGQTIFIKQSSPGTSQQIQGLKQQVQPGQTQTPGMQRIIAQIGGKPISVQIQQNPNQQQQQQKILAKVLANAGGGQLISVESLLAQKGLKLAATSTPTGQINRQGKQVIQTQYQVLPQTPTASGQTKISTTPGGQTVRMVTAQLGGKPIVLASGNKSVGVGINQSGGMVLAKQSVNQQTAGGQQQPIILPSHQLLNIKTIHGLKVIPTAAGLKSGTFRVVAPTSIATTQSSTSTTTIQQQTQQNITNQPPKNTFGTP